MATGRRFEPRTSDTEHRKDEKGKDVLITFVKVETERIGMFQLPDSAAVVAEAVAGGSVVAGSEVAVQARGGVVGGDVTADRNTLTASVRQLVVNDERMMQHNGANHKTGAMSRVCKSKHDTLRPSDHRRLQHNS